MSKELDQRFVAEDLTVIYKSRYVLRDLRFEALPGQVTLVIGKNGSGKSTLLRSLAGVIKPQSGRVFYSGADISTYDRRERLRIGIVYVRQKDNVYPHLSVLDNLRAAFIVGPRRVGFLQSVEKVNQLFPLLRDSSSKQAGLMSAGEKQQLAIAMALVQAPRVLLLDEPSTGLAPVLAEQVLSAISRLTTSRDISTILVEQNIGRAVQIASHINLLVGGLIERFDIASRDPHQYLPEILSRMSQQTMECSSHA
jgi:ABC-type branched-subunit amino acid transport system ATPase component